MTCTLLLPQLLQIWLPDSSAALPEDCSSRPSEQAPRSQTPPIISFLESFPDAITPDDFPGKKFPCGHVVDLRAILACCNWLGDAVWTSGPHPCGCWEVDCTDSLEFPTLPDPRVIDGLEARLDLIEWSFRKDKPTQADKNAVSRLRNILSSIGHVSQDSEPEADAESSPREPSESSLMQTLVHIEIEAFALMADMAKGSAKVPERGADLYCSYRARKPTSAYCRLRYPFPSPGQDCTCAEPHQFEREPKDWAHTPAESDDVPRDQKPPNSKTVRFVAPVVTEVQYFEPWWCAEYRDSDRYWSTGPFQHSVDKATSADDDWAIEILEIPEGLAARVEMGIEDGDSDCETLFDDEDVLDEMNEGGDRNVLEEMGEELF